MIRSVPFAYTSITSVLILAWAISCGHTQETMDAYEESKEGIVPSSSSGNSSGSGGTGGGVVTTCVPASGPQFDCSAPASQQFDTESMQAYCVPDEVAAEVKNVLQRMSPTEKAQQMMGIDGTARDYRDIERSPDVTLAGYGTIRGYRYRDAGHGVNLDAGQDNRDDTNENYSTVFPTASLRAASWDLDLEKRIGRAIGDETAASKNNMLLAPCMNIIRHPQWGRTQETYSEDVYHTGRMATAFTVGLQEFVVGCAKHFAANNIEKGRSFQNAVMDEQTLREIYGRHFEMVIRDGAMGCIMASYNSVNDIKATQNEHLLRRVLKAPLEEGGMGFDGLVLTDWWAMPGDQNVPDAGLAQSVTTEAVKAGTDIEVPWTLHYRVETLTAAQVDQNLVNDAARRVLTQKFLFNSARDTDPWSRKTPTSVLKEDGSLEPNLAHEDLAKEGAVRSAVLLNNGLGGTPVLPFTQASIAVVGPLQEFSLISSSVPKSCGFDEDNVGQGETNPNPRKCTFNYATDPALGDRGSSRVNGDPLRSYGPFKGIQTVAGDAVTVTKGNAATDVGEAEAIVVVVGYTPADEGEEYAIAGGGDRASLDLPAGHVDFVKSVLALMKPTVIIIESGSIVSLDWLDHENQNQATVWAGYPGQMGGLALGELILGKANFSGKMPMAWVTQPDQLQVFKESETLTNMGYFFGYREFDRRKYVDQTPVNLVYPFGHGMSYSTFEYSNLTMPCSGPVSKDAIFEVTVDIANTSTVPGDEVAMLFIKPPPKPEGATGARPWKELKSFARVAVPAEGMTTARLPVRVQDLRRWEGGADGQWVIDSGEYTVVVAKDAEAAEAADALKGTFTVN